MADAILVLHACSSSFEGGRPGKDSQGRHAGTQTAIDDEKESRA
jgi:hypothetical protein